ncbi:hypothetical protein, partial [Actinobacillus minor]|uniref:hypothetical protein n=1 Tax=Actinobacillus minor TaxID=51047 RepID=UPI0023F52330
SEVKCRNADGSVGFPHVRVGHRQIELKGTLSLEVGSGFLLFRILVETDVCPEEFIDNFLSFLKIFFLDVDHFRE